MPWKGRSVMDERMRFVIRLKDGESMASLCREFGISRKTGYKIFERYEQCGLAGAIAQPFQLARQLHRLRSGLYRPRGKDFAAPPKPLQAKSVTYVLGTICYLC